MLMFIVAYTNSVIRHIGVSEEIQTAVPWESQQLHLGQCRVKQCDFGELLPVCSLAVASHCYFYWNTVLHFQAIKKNCLKK